MMTLLLRDCADAIHEIQGLLEVGEPEVAAQTMLVDDRPFRYLCVKSSEFRSPERGGVSATGNAGFAGEVGHGSVLDSRSLPDEGYPGLAGSSLRRLATQTSTEMDGEGERPLPRHPIPKDKPWSTQKDKWTQIQRTISRTVCLRH